MKSYDTHQLKRYSLSCLMNGLVAATILSFATGDCYAQRPLAARRAFTNDIYYGQQVCPPQQPMPWYPSAPGPQYAPAPYYVPPTPGQPRASAPGAPMQQSPGRSLPDQDQSPQYQRSDQSQSQTPNAATNPDSRQNTQTSPSNPNSQSQVQNALDQTQNNGNPNNNIFQASLEQELGGQGGDSFGGAGYGRGAQAPPNSIGDFFGGRLRSRRSMISMGRTYLFLNGQQPDLFLEVDTTIPAILTDTAFQLDSNDVIRDDLQFTTTTSIIPVLGLPVTALRADNIVTTQAATAGDDDRFVLQTVDALPGIHPDPFDPAQQFTEDINRNGVLDPGEDLNMDGVISALIPTQTEVFGLYREIVIPNPGDMVGRLKIAENNNAVPRDRVIFDYTYFDNAAVTASGHNVQRYAPGFEKTLFGGNASIDVRIPFATTVESDISTMSDFGSGGLTNTGNAVLGNMSVTGKFLLANDEYSALSIGLQALLPTASDVVVTDLSTNSELVRIENEAIHLMPFAAWQHTPTQRSFLQYYVQYDHDSKGNPTSLRGNPSQTIRDVDFIYADFSAGYWMYRNTPRTRTTRHGNQINTAIEGNTLLTGFAPRLEFHYNRSLGNVEALQSSGIQLGESVDKLESLNMTLGATVQLGIDKELTMAWGTPLLNRNESDFDNEVRVMFNWILPQ